MDRRWWALGALVASMLVLGFDTTILNVALPTMAARLGATTGQQQWMADVYVVVFASLMLPAGLLGDRFGRRRMLLTGLGVFLAGSLVGAFVHSVELVIVARAAMGVGAALVMPLAMSVLPSLFRAPADRVKAVGIISAASALGLPLGPIVGGWLLEHFWWGSIFVINIPMVAISIAACVFLLPETRDPSSPKVDVLSAALTVLGLGSLIYGIIEAPGRGWGSALVVGTLTAGVLLLGALVLRERRVIRPMLDMTLLCHRGFLLNTLAATLVMFVLSGLLFLLPVYLQAVLGHDAFGTGLRLLPMMGGLLVAARTSGKLAARLGPRLVISAGLVVLAFAAFLASSTTVDSGYGTTALWLSIAGLGFGFTVVPSMDAALGALPADRAGSGSGLLLTVRQTGGAIGIALLGSLLAATYGDRLSTAGLPAAAADSARDSVVAAHIVADRLRLPDLTASANSAYVHGMDTAMVVCGIAALAAALLVAVLLPNPGLNPDPDSNPERAEDGADGGGVADGGDADVRTVAPLPVDGRQ
ncbi:MFS transporter [Streptomyces sp. 150FB]|uniref:MFS transporter n=1 Tax=Streptomyces sp. 150FB TaxID=1576605 RepID=UPI00099C2776|nr:MFS transporter [Streptomyces sp. 150FB]